MTAGNVPSDVVSAVLQVLEGLGRSPATRVDAVPLQTDGLSGNSFYRVVAHHGTDGPRDSTAFVVKQWDADSWTSIWTGSSGSREAQAWRAGLFAPHGLEIPILLAQETPSGALLVMEDITSECASFTAGRRNPECLASVLDRMAAFHVYWSHPRRTPECTRHPWLWSQESRIRLNECTFAAWLGDTRPEYRELWARFRVRNPDLEGAIRPGFNRFVDLIPAADRGLWVRHLTDRSELSRSLDGLLATFLHGDANERNFGLRGSAPEIRVLAVDWEFAGVGNPALDVASLLYHVFLFPQPEALGAFAAALRQVDEYVDYYFTRYRHHGGVAHPSVWERNWRLALLHYYLAMLPVHGGGALADPRARGRVLEQIEHGSELIRRELPA